MQLEIREAVEADWPELTRLMRGTIAAINSRDYDAQQIAAWLGRVGGGEVLRNRLATQFFWVAANAGQLVGFTSLAPDGYIDLMYVHQSFQQLGIARALYVRLESAAREKGLAELYSEVSITARPFFERMGFLTGCMQRVSINEIVLENFRMAKKLISS